MSIGEKIREARELCHLKQAELAEKIDANTVTVSRWERNINVPNSAALKKLASALSTTVAYLTGETDTPERAQQEQAPAQAQSELKSNVRFEDVVWVPVVTNEVKVCCGPGNMYPDEVTWEEVGKYPVLASQLVGYS